MDRENFFLGAGQHNSWELIRIRKQLARSQKCSADSQVRPKRFLLLVPRSENFFFILLLLAGLLIFIRVFFLCVFSTPRVAFALERSGERQTRPAESEKIFFLFVYAKEATKKISHLSFFYDFL
jgi:hypothetical protein